MTAPAVNPPHSRPSPPQQPHQPPPQQRPDAPAPRRSFIPGAGTLFIWLIILKSAVKSLFANKLRSMLAMLGIIIGIAAVIAMLAMGAGAQASVTQRFQAMGTNLLFIRPTQRGSGGVMSGVQQNLTVEDAAAIVALPGIESVSPVVNNSVQAKYMNRNNRTSVNGVSPAYFKMRNFEIEKGRTFNDFECDSLARVCVLGPTTAKTLFGNDEPLDQTVKFNNINFRVIGITKAKGDQGWNNPDDQAIVPYSTAMKILFGQDYLREIDIGCANDADLNAVSGQPANTPQSGSSDRRGGTLHKTPPPEDSVTALLRKRHRLTSLATADDFSVMNMAEMLANFSASITTFRILLGTIASISLLVGGIGIMNIMLVTVTERTREIGIRKAIGAKFRDILSQFVIEATFMSGIGGLVGAGLGIGVSLLIGYFASRTPGSVIPVPVVDPVYVILSVTVSGAVGVVFGVYPAYRAAQLDPIEALRYE